MKIVKQVLIVRKDLKMRKGKIGAQSAHAALGAVLGEMSLHYETDHKKALMLVYDKDEPLGLWLEGKFRKICVSVDSEEELLELEAKAKEAGLIHCMITDAGDTEFHGAPTKTVLAIGPAFAEEVDPLTGHLPLY